MVAEVTRHGLCMADIGEGPGDDNTVKAGEHPGNLCLVTLHEGIHGLYRLFYRQLGLRIGYQAKFGAGHAALRLGGKSSTMRDFHSLKVWKKSHQLVLVIYRISQDFPAEERFGLTLQIRRAAVSVSSTIAEGAGRSGDRELARFLNIAAGSISEVEYQWLLARDLGYIPDEGTYRDTVQQISEVKRMLNAFLQKLTADS